MSDELCTKCGWSASAHAEPFRSTLNDGNHLFAAPYICSAYVAPKEGT